MDSRSLIFILLLIPCFLFGQYGNERITNGTFTTDTNWNKGAEFTISGGQLNVANGDGSLCTQTGLSTSWQSSDSVRIKFEIVSHDVDVRILIGTSAAGQIFRVFPTYVNFNLNKTWIYNTGVVNNFDNTTIGITNAGNSEAYVFDNFTIRSVLDTLWISSEGAITDEDTTSSLADAFETRGSHSGGTFIAEPGPWAESITIDSSFTLWKSATAGQAVTVTAVDFNSVTATLLDIYVTTPTNDDNITYTYTPAATTETPKRKFGSYGGWGGW